MFRCKTTIFATDGSSVLVSSVQLSRKDYETMAFPSKGDQEFDSEIEIAARRAGHKQLARANHLLVCQEISGIRYTWDRLGNCVPEYMLRN